MISRELKEGMIMKKIFAALIAVIAVGAIAGTAVQAQDNMATGDSVTLAKDQVIDASYYAAGETLVINGTVQGDLYCAGNSVEINGTIEGDVLCAAQDLRIEGTVEGDVRAAGQNVTVAGEVGQSVTLMGQALEVSGKVGRDATLTGQIMRLTGEFERDVVAAGERLIVSGSIGRNVQMAGESTAFREGANVGGNVTYVSHNDADVDNGATISGNVVREDPPRTEAVEVGPMAWIAGALLAFAFLLPIGVAFVALAPRAAGSAVEYMRHRTLVTLGLGFLGFFLTPVLAVALMVTVIGLPLGVMLFMAWAMALPVAFVIGAYTVGAWMTAVDADHSGMRKFLAVLVGLILFITFSFLPYVGWAITLLIMIGGFGVITMGLGRSIRAQYTKQPAKKKAKTE